MSYTGLDNGHWWGIVWFWSLSDELGLEIALLVLQLVARRPLLAVLTDAANLTVRCPIIVASFIEAALFSPHSWLSISALVTYELRSIPNLGNPKIPFYYSLLLHFRWLQCRTRILLVCHQHVGALPACRVHKKAHRNPKILLPSYYFFLVFSWRQLHGVRRTAAVKGMG